MIKTFLIVMACLASATTARANDTTGRSALAFANESLKPALEKVVATQKQKEIDPAEKRKAYDAVISPFFNHSVTARLTLGKETWEKMTAGQRARFIHLFGKRLQNFYLQRLLLLYPDTELLFMDTKQENDKAVVNTELKSSHLKINRKVQYKIRYDGQVWKIYDIDINGVSILKNYRAQFNHFLAKHTVEDLLKDLERAE